MSAVLAGVLFSSSMLSEPWFQVFASFVAFNTLVYVGLTVAKAIPWPRQLRSAQVRALRKRTAYPPIEPGDAGEGRGPGV